jgi:hypothetical protein
MDWLSVPMKKPAADFDSPAETDALGQRVEMEEIFRGSS